MSDIFFFVKTFVLTVAIIVLMQIEVGQRSIESHALSWIHTSPIIAPLNGAAKGASKLIRDTYDSIQKKIKNPFR